MVKSQMFSGSRVRKVRYVVGVPLALRIIRDMRNNRLIDVMYLGGGEVEVVFPLGMMHIVEVRYGICHDCLVKMK